MPIRDLKEQIARLPEQPGVYLYGNAAGETIYVGKARSLRDRVRSYLNAHGSSPKTDALLREVTSLAVTVTDSVVEALALENSLIKTRTPKYNILLRDDKNYPYLKLTIAERYPQLLVVRRVDDDGNVYAGPFIPGSAARRTMDLAHRLFGLRSCHETLNGHRDRPCLEYDIKRCVAPCVEAICPPERYAHTVQHTRWLLEGKTDALIAAVRQQMADAAAGERFEEAARLRDAIRTLEDRRDRQQKMATVDTGDRDVFGLKRGAIGAAVHVFLVRHGSVRERAELGTGHDLAGDTDAAVLTAALQQFYEDRVPPPEIHVPVEPDDRDALVEWLIERSGHAVRLLVPQRGEKRQLVDLATRNAWHAYRERSVVDATPPEPALDRLQEALRLPTRPARIDCFDISTLQGSETVASMVVCVDGEMARREYRKFRVRGTHAASHRGASGATGGPDGRLNNDFAAMHEVVERRYRAVQGAGGPFPDLIIIDGGRGQLDAAYAALEGLGLAHLVAVGLAKKEELIVTRDATTPLALAREDAALRLLQRIRDEAHRFAVTFHRQSRRRRDLTSALDDIPGVGPRRRRQLLATFGSVAGIRRATREELATAVGAKLADAVLAFFTAQT